MTTQYPRNFGPMLHAFLAGWRPYLETIDFQHIDSSVNPETGRKVKRPGPWIPCRSLTELIATVHSWPITDNYVTAQRFASRVSGRSPTEASSRPPSSDHSAFVLDRIYTDTDPGDGRADCLDLLPRFKRMQDELEVDGRSAVWINCSGRGYHSYTYLDRPVTVAEGRRLQDILGYVYGLELDYWAPITQARMMRLPYSKNSRTGSWVLCVGRNMSLGGLRNAMNSSLALDGCHWENPSRLSPSTILRLHPGDGELDEYRTRRREHARARVRRSL